MRFLFCSLASPGFLYPAIGIAQKLRNQGHAVAIVTDLVYGEQLAQEGLERIPRGPQDGNSFQVSIWGQPLSVAIQVKHIEYAIDRFQPDVLIGQQLTIGPMLVRARRNLPTAVIGGCTYLWPASHLGPEGAISEREKRLDWRYGDMLRLYNEARSVLRLPPCSADCRDAPFLGDLFMLQSTSELERDISRLPEQIHLVGACLWEGTRDDPELETWLREARETGAPVIYVQHGRFFDTPSFWPHLVGSLADMNIRVVASVARMDSDAGKPPQNFFVRPHVPQSRVLRHAKAMIASANTTAVLGALTAGVPSLLIPSGGEQPDVAERCEAVGAARVLPPSQVSVERLRSELRILLEDEAIKQAANRMALAFSKIDSFTVAAELLEVLASTRSPVLRKVNHVK